MPRDHALFPREPKVEPFSAKRAAKRSYFEAFSTFSEPISMKLLQNRMVGISALAAALGLSALLFLQGCSGSAPLEDLAEEEQTPPPLVSTVVIEPQAWQETVDLTAELHPWSAVTVAAETGGRVVDLLVDHGDQVQKGQLIARLETAGAQAELRRAKARLESSRASLAQASRDLERGKALAEASEGIVSQDDVERLALAHETRAAEAAEAEAAVLVMQEQVEDMEVRSPFTGVVSERHVEKGSWVAKGDPVVRLLDLRKLKIRASVPSIDRMRLSLDQKATFKTDAVPEVSHAAELRFLGREADPATGTFLVEAATTGDGSAGALLPGLQGTLTLTLAEHQGLLIPKTALLGSGSGEQVFVVDGETASRVDVDTKSVDARRVEVVTGLSSGMRLVTQGQHRLADGQLVEEHEP